MKYYLYANAIADNLGKVEKKVIKDISDALKTDLLYTQQRFTGRGFSKILSFDESRKDDSVKAQESLKMLGIESVIIDGSVTAALAENAFKAAFIEEFDNRYRFVNFKGEDLYIDKADELLVVGGIDMKRSAADTLKKLCLEEGFAICLFPAKERRLICLDVATVNLAKIKGASKYSKTENVGKFLGAFKESSENYIEDFNYSLRYSPESSPNLKIYSAIAALLFEKNLYSFRYPESFYNPQFKEDYGNRYYDFKFDIYRPGEFSKKIKPVKKLNLAQKAAMPVIPAVFIGMIFLRTQAEPLVTASCFVIFAYYAFHFFSILRMKLFFESVNFSKIESMSVGLNEVSGMIADRNAIPSPISGVRAVYFRYSKYRKVKVKDENEEWRLAEVGEYVPSSFFIENGGNALEVKTENASINLHSSTEYRRTFYEFYCMEDPDRVKFVEEALPVGSEAFVLGSAMYADRNRELESYIRNKKSDREYIKKFDADKDNFIDEGEWENARRSMELEFDEAESKKKGHEHLSMQYTKDDGILFISDMSEKSMLRRFTVFLCATGALGIISLISGILIIWR